MKVEIDGDDRTWTGKVVLQITEAATADEHVLLNTV